MYPEKVSVADLIALGAALISAVAILATIAKQRDLRKKELADRVRRSSALIIAKLDRWKQIAQQVIDELQMAATEADGHIVSLRDPITTRDLFWKQVVAAQAALRKSLLDEQIEIAYSEMYGYDPRIHELFTAVVARLKLIDTLIFLQLLNRTQKDILTMRVDGGQPVASAMLGNKLRRTLADSQWVLETRMEAVLSKFREGMTAIVRADDNALIERRVAIPSCSILPPMKDLRADIYSVPSVDKSFCQAIFDSVRESDLGSTALDPWPRGIEFPEVNQSSPDFE